MAHSVFTIVAPVDPEHIVRLDEVLARMQQAVQGAAYAQPVIPFGDLDQLHFACFVVFDRDTPEPLLVFENNVDGPIGRYLDALIDRAGLGIDAVYENCKGFPVGGTLAEKRRYLRKRVRTPHVYHVGAAYRQARAIQEDRDLRDRLDARVDALSPRLPPKPPAPSPGEPLPSWIRPAVATLAMSAGIVAASLGLRSVRSWVAAGGAVSIALLWRAWRRDRARKRGQEAVLGASAPSEPAAAGVWEQLRASGPFKRYHEWRALQRLKNWPIALSPWLVATLLIRYAWGSHLALAAGLATLFALEMVWLIVLAGWPSATGEWPRSWIFVPLAAAGGVFLGSWPFYRPLSGWTALALLGWLALDSLAHVLSARRARATFGGWWWMTPFLLLAGGLTWLANDAVAPWTACARPVLGVLARIAVAAVAFPAAFVLLVFRSIKRRPPPGASEVPLWFWMLGGGIVAGLSWLVSGPSFLGWLLAPPHALRPWLAPVVLGLLAYASLLALWRVAPPSPTQRFQRPTREKLRALTADEDRSVQNHMATMVRVRTDWQWSRAVVLKSFLGTLNRLLYRTVLPDWWRGTLFGIHTVHFAQWTVLDRRRHMFLSNYDLSWTAYLDDFGAQLGGGIQLIWGQSEGNPGLSRVDDFKEFVRTQMVPHSVWYSAYPELTVDRVRSNESVRRALLASEA